jgi:hypothetical protein
MKPTIEQRLEQVKQKIQIDLTQKDRKRINFYLRIIITCEYPEMTLKAIANAFNTDHATILYYRRNFEKNSKIPEYKLTAEALRLGIHPEDLIPKKQRINKPYDVKKHIPAKTIQEVPTAEVMKVLETDRKHYLWNKEVHRWEKIDWNNFYKLRDLLKN